MKKLYKFLFIFLAAFVAYTISAHPSYANSDPVITSNYCSFVPQATQESPTANEPISESLLFTDADTSDVHTSTWDWGDGTTTAGKTIESDGFGTIYAGHTYTQPGTYNITITLMDNNGGIATKNCGVTQNPQRVFVSPISGSYSSPVTINLQATSEEDLAHAQSTCTYIDNGVGTVAHYWAIEAEIAPKGTTELNPPSNYQNLVSNAIPISQTTASYSFNIPNGYDIYDIETWASPTTDVYNNACNSITWADTFRSVEVWNSDHNSTSNYSFFDGPLLTILHNNPPTVGAITVSTNPVLVNNATTASASFTDTDVSDTHSASWNWGDGNTTTGSVTESNGSGSVSNSHTYTSAGVYPITLTVTDNNGGQGTQTYQYISVYNPTAQGLFSAGQKYTSPAGAYAANTSLTGNVLFGLSYKYQGTVPTGNRQFSMDFNTANLHFNATSVNALVIANGMGTLTGTGTLNGSGTYNFLMTGSETNNTIRIQIKDSSNNVIYDTQPGAADTATPTTSVTAGTVLAH